MERSTVQTRMVLAALLRGEQYGLEIARRTGLGRSSVYAILDRLQQDGLVRARREEEEDEVPHPGRTRYYWRLSGETSRSVARDAEDWLLDHLPVGGLPTKDHRHA